MVKTSGTPDDRSKSYIPKHIKYYTMKGKTKQTLPVTEEQFAQEHPTQYKALNLYSYVQQKHNKKPLNKVKNVVGYNKSLNYVNDKLQTRANYTWQDNETGAFHESIVLPNIQFKEKETQDINNPEGKAVYQAESIAHEDIHSQQAKESLLKDEEREKHYLKLKSEYGQKKYRSLPTEQEADQNKKEFKQSLDKSLDEPSTKEKIRNILGMKKGSSSTLPQ